MKETNFISFLVTIFVILMTFSSCNQDLLDSHLLDSPTVEKGSYVKGSVLAPEKLEATQGGYRSITLTWTPVKDAVKYEIYESSTATGDNFIKKTETNEGKSEVVIKDNSDVLKYYKVKAFDQNGNASPFSSICCGSTLAAPVITNVIQGASGHSMTVKWYGGQNCTNETYLSEVIYEVFVYSDQAGTNVVQNKLIDDGSTSCEFTNLDPKTVYYYKVDAYLKSEQTQIESSAIVDKETAHRLIPNAVHDFEATQGISVEEVVLTFGLPNFVDVGMGGGIFEQHPLYFEISRAEIEYKESGEVVTPEAPETPSEGGGTESGGTGASSGNDAKSLSRAYKEGAELTEFVTIATIKSHHKTPSSEFPIESDTYYFDCSSGESSKIGDEELLSVSESNDPDSVVTSESYPAYCSNYILKFKDKTAERGKVYRYKITSYVDDIAKKVTSDESLAVATGWLIAIPNLSVIGPKYIEDPNEKGKIISATITFHGEFEEFGMSDQYTYIVTQYATDFDGKTITFDGNTEKLVMMAGHSHQKRETIQEKEKTVEFLRVGETWK